MNVGFPGWPGTKEDSDSRYVWAFIQSRDLQPPACMLIIRDHRYGKANEPKRIDPSSSIFSPCLVRCQYDSLRPFKIFSTHCVLKSYEYPLADLLA